MPTYNRKYCIKNAIDSLLAQTYQDFELIIIDDGSQDGTEDHVKSLYGDEIKNGKIIFIGLPENRGASFARNEGLKKTQYEWIGYLDSDNRMHPDFLETFAENINRYPNYEIFYAQHRGMYSKCVCGASFNFDRLLMKNYIDMGVFMHSKKVYRDLGGFDNFLYRCADWDLILRYTENRIPIFIEKVVLDYSDDQEALRITTTEDYDKAYKKIILKYYQNIPAKDFRSRYQKDFKEIDLLQNSLAIKDQKIVQMEASKFWKLREKYLFFKKVVRKRFT